PVRAVAGVDARTRPPRRGRAARRPVNRRTAEHTPIFPARPWDSLRAVSSPAAEGPTSPHGPAPVGVGDIFATAFARYGGGFATFGVMTAAAAAAPAVLLGVLLASSSPAVGLVAAETLLATVAYLSLVGAVTAVLGERLRRRLW